MTTNREDLYGKALDHLEKWELDEAEETLRRLLEEEPEHARAVNKLGVVYARRQDLRQAEMCFNDAIALDPSWPVLTRIWATSTRSKVGMIGPRSAMRGR